MTWFVTKQPDRNPVKNFILEVAICAYTGYHIKFQYTMVTKMAAWPFLTFSQSSGWNITVYSCVYWCSVVQNWSFFSIFTYFVDWMPLRYMFCNRSCRKFQWGNDINVRITTAINNVTENEKVLLQILQHPNLHLCKNMYLQKKCTMLRSSRHWRSPSTLHLNCKYWCFNWYRL